MQKKKSEFLEAISREGITDTNLAQHRLHLYNIIIMYKIISFICNIYIHSRNFTTPMSMHYSESLQACCSAIIYSPLPAYQWVMCITKSSWYCMYTLHFVCMHTICRQSAEYIYTVLWTVFSLCHRLKTI